MNLVHHKIEQSQDYVFSSIVPVGLFSPTAISLKFCCKILEIVNKVMNFFLNHGPMSLNTVPTPQNIFLVLMVIEKHIWII